MDIRLNKTDESVKKHIIKRFKKRAPGLDGTWRLAGMKRSEIAVYLVLTDAINDYFDSIFYCQEKIGELAGYTRETTNKALKALRDKGLITWTSRGWYIDPTTKKRRNYTNEYHVTEKILDFLPYDVLTGQMFQGECSDPNAILDPYGKVVPADLWAEFQEYQAAKQRACVIVPIVTQPPHSVNLVHRDLRSGIQSIPTLTNADAFAQDNQGSQSGFAEEKNGPTRSEIPRETGIDFSTVEPRSKVMRSEAERLSPPTEVTKTENPPVRLVASKRKNKSNSQARKREAVSPALYDASIEIAMACREAQQKCGTKTDSYFSYFQYQQIAGLIELTGSMYEAKEYVEYVVMNWKNLKEKNSTGAQDSAKLLSYPTLNQMLAPWRINIWFAWSKGIQTEKMMKKRAANFKKLKKAEDRVSELEDRMTAMQRENEMKPLYGGFVSPEAKQMYERMLQN